MVLQFLSSGDFMLPPALIPFEIRKISFEIKRQVQEEMGDNCVLYELGLN